MIESVEYLSLLIIPLFLLFTVLYGTVKKVRVYDSFVAGAKEGPAIILKIFPYLLTIFVAIKGFQASGTSAPDTLSVRASAMPPRDIHGQSQRPISGS